MAKITPKVVADSVYVFMFLSQKLTNAKVVVGRVDLLEGGWSFR